MGTFEEREAWGIAQDWESRVHGALQVQQDLAEDRLFLELLLGQMWEDVKRLEGVEIGLVKTMQMHMDNS